MGQAPPEPRINVSNNQIMLFLSLWAVFSQVKDVAFSWWSSSKEQAASNERVAQLVEDVSAQGKVITKLTAEIETVKGDIKAEINRSFGADQAHEKTIDFISDVIKPSQHQQQQKPEVPVP